MSLLPALVLFGCSVAPAPPPRAKPAPSAVTLVKAAATGLRFDTPDADLGVVGGPAAVTHAFTFVNHGPGPAAVTDIRPSCGCLRSTPAKTRYAPGERGAIPLTIHTAGQGTGRKRFELRLTVRDPAERTVLLTAAADLQNPVAVEPSNLIVHLSPGQTQRHTITLIDRRRPSASLTAVTGAPPAVSAELLPPGPDPRRREVALTITGGAPGRAEHAVVLYLSGPGAGEGCAVEVPVVVAVRQDVEVLPEAVTVPPAAGPVRRRLRVLDRTGNSPLVKVVPGHAGVTAAVRTEGGGWAAVDLTVAPGTPVTEVVLHFAGGRPPRAVPVRPVARGGSP